MTGNIVARWMEKSLFYTYREQLVSKKLAYISPKMKRKYVYEPSTYQFGGLFMLVSIEDNLGDPMIELPALHTLNKKTKERGH